MVAKTKMFVRIVKKGVKIIGIIFYSAVKVGLSALFHEN
jgi:hypothetical protein